MANRAILPKFPDLPRFWSLPFWLSYKMLKNLVLLVKNSRISHFFSNFYSVRFQNRAKSGNLGKIARFAIRVKPGIVLIEFVLSGDLLYKILKDHLSTNYFWMGVYMPSNARWDGDKNVMFHIPPRLWPLKMTSSCHESKFDVSLFAFIGLQIQNQVAESLAHVVWQTKKYLQNRKF